VQSLRNDALKFLGRKHDVAQAKQALQIAAQYFPRFSFDLIYARHGQTEKEWETELREALTLSNGHLSLYQLTIEPNTQFYTLANRGEKLIAPEEHAANMYELTQQILSDAGMPAYEISNHARPGLESRHNLTYWHYDDYIGIGPGAHGRYQSGDRRFATEDHKAPEVWLRHVAEKNHGLRVCDVVDNVTAQREALMMNLRLTEGIDTQKWQQKFRSSLHDFLPQDKITHLIDEKYLVNEADTLKATEAGLQRLNAVLGYLLG